MSTTARRAGIVAALVSSAALIAPAFAGALPTGSPRLGRHDRPRLHVLRDVDRDHRQRVGASRSPTRRTRPPRTRLENVFDTDGSLELAVDGITDRSVSYHSAGSITLADAAAKEIGFSERAVSTSAAFQVRLTGTTNPGRQRLRDSGVGTESERRTRDR